jgi:hypothetical protein
MCQGSMTEKRKAPLRRAEVAGGASHGKRSKGGGKVRLRSDRTTGLVGNNPRFGSRKAKPAGGAKG